ncbi:MAG: amino acid ABC transporter permease [Clostridia bacterium]|nr:amino acid ABC transporter permease [Clostridia bacterium]MBO7738202.1 amino acid ABC transporter permease [Clostridia bacterium]
MADFFKNIADQFVFNFIEGDRWRIILDGLLVTLKVTFFAALIGIVLGFLVGLVRATEARGGIRNWRVKSFCKLCSAYVTVIRGTPVMVQLLIIYFVVFASVDIDKSLAAIIAFGFNSGAYVSEIFRSGILSIDIGQTEAGRSLGLTSAQTMARIILPQAIKNALPALGNEMITLLKETSVVGYIGLVDLTKSYSIIQSRTLSAFWPLIAIAVIYLVMVAGLTKLLSIFERRLRQSDKR